MSAHRRRRGHLPSARAARFPAPVSCRRRRHGGKFGAAPAGQQRRRPVEPWSPCGATLVTVGGHGFPGRSARCATGNAARPSASTAHHLRFGGGAGANAPSRPLLCARAGQDAGAGGASGTGPADPRRSTVLRSTCSAGSGPVAYGRRRGSGGLRCHHGRWPLPAVRAGGPAGSGPAFFCRPVAAAAQERRSAAVRPARCGLRPRRKNCVTRATRRRDNPPVK